jgi:circadian clock protein KaiC
MIDSLTGWNAAIEHDKLDSLLRELTNYLTLKNVTVVLINEVKDITGKFTVTEEHISHLSDNIIYLRYVEFDGELRKIIGVLKKRMSDFERSIREIHLNEDGIQVGESMKNLHGLLGGSPKSVRED